MSSNPRRLMHGAALAAVWLACTAGPVLAQGRTIVGEWAPDPANCLPYAGAIKISALSLVGDEMSCQFRSVARQGDVVTWQGRCDFADSSMPVTVVAALTGQRLSVRINRQPADTYRRCGA
jgi:hypothetical protein